MEPSRLQRFLEFGHMIYTDLFRDCDFFLLETLWFFKMLWAQDIWAMGKWLQYQVGIGCLILNTHKVSSAINACFENFNLLQHDWYIRKQFEHKWISCLLMYDFCQQEAPGEHRILHPVEPSHIGIHKMDTGTHTWNIYQLPQFTVCYGPHPPTAGITPFPVISDNLLSTT